MKCFKCNREGHLVRGCPENKEHETIINSDGEGHRKNVSENQQERDSDLIENERREDSRSEQRANHEDFVSKDDEKKLGQEKYVIESGVAGSVVELETSRDIDMTDDDSLFKTPTLKRKTKVKKKKVRKEQVQEKQMKELDQRIASDHSISDDSLTESESESVSSVDSGSLRRSGRNAYTLEKIKAFLQSTKGMKGVQVEDFFPDRELFIESARGSMKEKGIGGLTEQEIYRLKKWFKR